MRALIAILLILLVTILFFQKDISAWFSKQTVKIQDTVEDNLGSFSSVNGVKLRHNGSITVSQAMVGDLLQLNLESATISLTGSDSDTAELLIGYREYKPGDASFRIDGSRLISHTQSGKPVLITSVDGSIPKALSLKASSGNGEVQISAMQGSQEISIDTGNGAMEADNCNAKKLVLDSGNGAILLNSCQADRVEVNTGNGAINITNSQIGFLAADTGLGDIVLRSSQIRDKQLDTGLGKILEN